jgi:phosphinothricin acetyltransferase
MDNAFEHEHIRFAEPDDAQEILNIYAPYVADTCISFETEVPTVEQFAERIRNILAKYPFLVYLEDNKIAGYAYASRHRERSAYQYSVDVSVYIAPENHRHGIGKALYEKLFELLRAQSIYTIFAGVAQPNKASMELHKSVGFTEVGTYHNVGYKHGKWIDVTWLEKPLREYYNPEITD